MTFSRSRITLAALAVATIALSAPAEARGHHHHRHHHHYRHTAPAGLTHAVNWTTSTRYADDQDSRYERPRHFQARASGEGYLPHPAGCPSRAFCACGAAVEVFGSAIRSLWPASAWYRFPRTSPAPGMVGVRSHHVFVLRQHVEGSVWLIADYNSGGHQSRLHQRSISGYAIVNPHGARYASR